MKRELGIARCGLACCLCSENDHCSGCNSGECPDKGWCENRRCSIEKGYTHCYECSEDCKKGLLSKSKPYGFTLFAKTYGEEVLLDCLARNEKAGVVYHRKGIVGDYDEFEDVDKLIAFIKTGRKDGKVLVVSLRPMTAEMYHAYYQEYQNDPDLYINKSEYKQFVYSPEWVDCYIQRQIECNRKCLAVMYGEEIAGEIILKDIKPGKSATLSICMKNDQYKGRGIGTQAERLAIDYVCHELDIPVLYADSILSNERSQHVLEKVGFQLLRTEGVFKYYMIERQSNISR